MLRAGWRVIDQLLIETSHRMLCLDITCATYGTSVRTPLQDRLQITEDRVWCSNRVWKPHACSWQRMFGNTRASMDALVFLIQSQWHMSHYCNITCSERKGSKSRANTAATVWLELISEKGSEFEWQIAAHGDDETSGASWASQALARHVRHRAAT